MKRGLYLNRKPKPVVEKKAYDLSTTSKARSALEHSRRRSTAEEHATLENRVAEKYPDVLLSRRNM